MPRRIALGILDDAIREHLDLKRRLGAEDSELARLEDEAFGPPSRPGDPDFPEADASATGTDTALAEPPAEELAAPEEAPAAQEPQAPIAEPEPPSEAIPEAEQPDFYDHGGDELDLDLDLEAEVPPAPEPEPAAPEAEAPPAPEPPPPLPPEPPIESLDTVEHTPTFEPPIESLDTVEHDIEGVIEDTGEAEAVAPPPAETGEADVLEPPIEDTGEVEVVEGELEVEGEEEDEEDVLEETPEFLRDQPEDDELWFEQGEPKDFDF